MHENRESRGFCGRERERWLEKVIKARRTKI